jgi:putative membrane-bound dehydrogenase-like protein
MCACAALPQTATPSFPRVPPLSPAEAAKSFRVLHGFRMELVAAEPLVTDPVAMAFDEHGRAYVCEMIDYPYTDKARHQPNQENPTDAPLGRVRLLEDTDGDGRFDKSTVFAEGLSWPTGVACWQGGVFVIATPDLWYLKDTDGDGQADIRERRFTGFRKLNVQAVANNLVWGLDNRIHGAGGSNSGDLIRAGEPNAKPLRLGRADFALDPRTGELTLASGGARFGNAFDDAGNRFLCNIRNPAQHVVLEQRYLARNPHMPVINPVHDIAEAGDQLPVFRTSPVEQWRAVRADRWVAERSLMPRSELVAAGVVTSSSGVSVYRGDAFPPAMRGQVFIADVAGNLFYRLQLEPAGATFRATRADERADFVTSDDLWFRPVNFVNAPDGTLHVLDMYREVIEHPWSIPDDIHAALDLRSGADRGRIWRLVPPGFKPPKPAQLGKATTAQLVAALGHRNAWWRETAQRLLVERQDQAAIKPLQALLKRSKEPLARLHALWTLHGLNSVTDEDVQAALRDAEPANRENALKVAEAILNATAAFPLAQDPSARVRFQAALTLGELNDPRVPGALAAIAQRDAADPWLRAAVLSSSATFSDGVLIPLLADPAFADCEGASPLLHDLAVVIGARNQPAEIRRLWAALKERSVAGAALGNVVAGLAAGLKRGGSSLSKLAASSDPETAGMIQGTLSSARHSTADPALSLAKRLAAVQLLTHDTFANAEPALRPLFDSRQPRALQVAAVRALGSFTAPQVAEQLLAGWRGFTPAVRSAAIEALLARQERIPPLLKALEEGVLPPAQLTTAHRARLLRNRDEQVRARAEALLGAQAGSRREVLAQFEPALSLTGDRARGRAVYDKLCAVCHRLGDRGNDVGPNLATMQHRSAADLLTQILDPNREVAPEFAQYEVELNDGSALSGIVTADTAAGLTLRRADGSQTTIPRAQIARLHSGGLSLMPEGLEAGLTSQDFADLLAFLKQP